MVVFSLYANVVLQVDVCHQTRMLDSPVIIYLYDLVGHGVLSTCNWMAVFVVRVLVIDWHGSSKGLSTFSLGSLVRQLCRFLCFVFGLYVVCLVSSIACFCVVFLVYSLCVLYPVLRVSALCSWFIRFVSCIQYCVFLCCVFGLYFVCLVSSIACFCVVFLVDTFCVLYPVLRVSVLCF